MSAPATMTDGEIAELDGRDPLAAFRSRFELPPGVVYLDGNSLGALPIATAGRLQRAVSEEWGRDLIRSWNSADWIGLPSRVGDKIGRLIGAAPGETVVADSTSVNLFKVLAAAIGLKPGRHRIVSQRDNFPTDLYMAQGLAAFLGQGHELVLLPDDPDAATVEAALAADTAVLMLTHVNYRTGRIHDMTRLTGAAHRAGAFALWDLAHSAGALPVGLNRAGADFAVGCGYKYLNGGPGAPAFLWVAERHQASFAQPLSGWMGHAAPFAFDARYRPAEGIARYLCGTPPVLGATALECGVDLMLEADMDVLREKSIALTSLFIERVESRCPGLDLVSPRNAAERGSQVSFRHPHGYALMQALISRGVIGDFRAPDIIRFGFAPLYVSYRDVAIAVDILADLIASGGWNRPEFHARAAVT
ncbi:MAG TPA: kynureninase [Rhodocyclaceae bacterium]|nr:kynureninase [Rhodocyclaceae bacterium]HRQ46884.1 kynureninase [Rhodocyclaceae bacterium]